MTTSRIDQEIAARYAEALKKRRTGMSELIAEGIRENDRERLFLHRFRHLLPHNLVIVVGVVALVIAMRMLNPGILILFSHLGMALLFSIFFHPIFFLFTRPVRPTMAIGWISHVLFIAAHGLFVDANPYSSGDHARTGFAALTDFALGVRIELNWNKSQVYTLGSLIGLALSYCVIFSRSKMKTSTHQ